MVDEPVQARNGEIFQGLDLQYGVEIHQADYYAYLQRAGVQVYFIIYNLLPILMPQFFGTGLAQLHSRWLAALVQFDGLICIARAVADEVLVWLNANQPKRSRPRKRGHKRGIAKPHFNSK